MVFKSGLSWFGACIFISMLLVKASFLQIIQNALENLNPLSQNSSGWCLTTEEGLSMLCYQLFSGIAKPSSLQNTNTTVNLFVNFITCIRFFPFHPSARTGYTPTPTSAQLVDVSKKVEKVPSPCPCGVLNFWQQHSLEEHETTYEWLGNPSILGPLYSVHTQP